MCTVAWCVQTDHLKLLRRATRTECENVHQCSSKSKSVKFLLSTLFTVFNVQLTLVRVVLWPHRLSAADSLVINDDKKQWPQDLKNWPFSLNLQTTFEWKLVYTTIIVSHEGFWVLLSQISSEFHLPGIPTLWISYKWSLQFMVLLEL